MKMRMKIVGLAVAALAQAAYAVESPYDFVACSHGRRIALEANPQSGPAITACRVGRGAHDMQSAPRGPDAMPLVLL